MNKPFSLSFAQWFGLHAIGIVITLVGVGYSDTSRNVLGAGLCIFLVISAIGNWSLRDYLPDEIINKYNLRGTYPVSKEVEACVEVAYAVIICMSPMGIAWAAVYLVTAFLAFDMAARFCEFPESKFTAWLAGH